MINMKYKVTVSGFCPFEPECSCCYSKEESTIWTGDSISNYINKDRGLFGKIENGCCNPHYRLYECIEGKWSEVTERQKVAMAS
jgi:hypothetical protein